MNLTKYHKSAIVACILNDLPKIDYAREKADEQAALMKALIVGDSDYEKILAPFKEKKEKRDAIKYNIESAIESVKTRKQFIDKFPELSAYAPEENSPTSNLPAVANIIADLVAIGWNQKVHKGNVKIK